MAAVRARSTEPLWWALFSGGGMLAALFLPALIVVTGILIPFGLVPEAALAYERVYAGISHPLARIVLFGLIALPLFHAAHRLLFTLGELGLRPQRAVLALLCYGAAIAGAVVAAVVLVRL
jgi:fumarate reductase subunit D